MNLEVETLPAVDASFFELTPEIRASVALKVEELKEEAGAMYDEDCVVHSWFLPIEKSPWNRPICEVVHLVYLVDTDEWALYSSSDTDDCGQEMYSLEDLNLCFKDFEAAFKEGVRYGMLVMQHHDHLEKAMKIEHTLTTNNWDKIYHRPMTDERFEQIFGAD